MALYSVVDGVSKNLTDVHTSTGGVDKYITNLKTSVDSVAKELLSRPISSIIDHIEFSVGYNTCSYRSVYWDGSVWTYGNWVYTKNLSDYSGKMTYTVSGNSVTLNAQSGWGINLHNQFIAVLLNGRRIPLANLIDYTTGVNQVSWVTSRQREIITTPTGTAWGGEMYGVGPSSLSIGGSVSSAATIIKSTDTWMYSSAFNATHHTMFSQISVVFDGKQFTPVAVRGLT